MVARSLFAFLVATLAATSAGWAKGPETYPLSKVRRGQTGYGLTTMKGTTPERFRFEVIGVNKNFLPKMDIILVKSDDPKLAVTGFWQGMSGSPLFIEGKLTCAFSYGFRFNKVAIGGCTPIHYMKEEGLRDARGIGRQTRPRKTSRNQSRIRLAPARVASMSEWRRAVPGGDVSQVFKKPADPVHKPWLLSDLLPRRRSGALMGNDGLRPASVPLAMSGFAPAVFAKAKELFAGFPLEPMQAGGSGSSNSGPTEFTLGGSISVQLIRGDMSIAGTGTVSYLDGNKVLAFGHPMFQAGEIYAPVATAHVHTVIPSALSAFVVASPMREIGSLVHDRQSTISADTDLRTPMIPMTINIESEGKKSSFKVELLNNRFFTATLANMSAMSAISHQVPDRDRVTVMVRSKVHIRGHKPLGFVDHFHSANGPMSTMAQARGLRVLAPLFMNPFSPVEIEKIELSAKVSYGTNFAKLVGIRLPAGELPAGKRTYLHVDMIRYNGNKFSKRIPFNVPKELAGSIVKLEVTSGNSVTMATAPPQNLTDLLKIFRDLPDGNTYAITLYTASEGLAIDGRLVADLPPTVADRLHTTSDTPRTKIHRARAQSLVPSQRVIVGKVSTLVKVADDDL